MKVIAKLGREDIAVVYIAETDGGRRIEFVESLEPPIPREKKWVNIVSTLFGCPGRCPMCDAGTDYHGRLTIEEILFQTDYLVSRRYAENIVPGKKWKIQFARMGEPSFNPNVLDALEILPCRYCAPGLLPSVSTIAPRDADKFFERLLAIKHRLYPTNFQFQFSLHSTDEQVRSRLIPLNTWSLSEMAAYGNGFYQPGGRKITLNFALMQNAPIDADVLFRHFNPKVFLVKITPLNPSHSVYLNNLKPLLINSPAARRMIANLERAGYSVIVSIGELEENAIGSNCGQFVSGLERTGKIDGRVYSYQSEDVGV